MENNTLTKLLKLNNMDIIKKIKQLFSHPKCITCGKPIDSLFEEVNEHIQCKIGRCIAESINENDRMYEEALKRINKSDNKNKFEK